MIRASKLIGRILAALVVLLFVAILAIAVLVGTSSGSRWLLAQVPGLHSEQFQGRLAGRWQAERVIWEQGGNRVDIEAPRVAWSPSCLLRMTLCVDELLAGDIELMFPPGPEQPDSEPFSLPDIQLPLQLDVRRVELGRLRLNESEQWQNLQLQANWRSDGLDIQTFRMHREELQLDLTGRLEPNGQWPLALTGNASLAAPDDRSWTLQIALDGELKDALQLDVDSQGYLVANLKGEISPLDAKLPATLQLTADDFKAAQSLPDSLRLDDLQMSLDGNLEDGFELSGDGLFAGEGGAVRLVLDGLLKQTGAEIDTLELDAGEQRKVRLNGTVDWQDKLEAEAQLSWTDFPWRQLYPQIDGPPVALRTLNAQVQYDDGNYLGNFDAALSGPAGDFTLESPVSGNLELVHLPQLQLQAGQGRVDGSLSVDFANGIGWTTLLSLSELDPSYWVAQLPGTLGGTLRSRGVLREEILDVDASLNVDGKLRNQPAHLELELNGQGGRWDLAAIDLRLGDNSIEGSGRWADTLAGRLKLDAPRLAQLWPGLSGQLGGDVQLTGTPTEPIGQLVLAGNEVAYQDNGVQRLQLNAGLAKGQRATMQLSTQGLRAGDTDLGELQLDADGTLQAHQASMQLRGGLLELALAVDGSLDKGAWHGRLLRGELSAEQQRWSLQQPAAIQRLADGRLDLAAHCWASGPATLCAENQRLMPDPQLRYHLRDLPLESLGPYLPEGLVWQGELNADIELDIPESGPNGTIALNAGPGVLRMREGDDWHDFPYRTLTMNSELTASRIDSELRFEGGNNGAGQLGDLDVQLQIDPASEAKDIDGEFRLSNLDLSVARPFLPQVERLRGQLNGRGRLVGSLRKPQIIGELNLSGGEISGRELPVSFENLELQARMEGQRLRIEGGWRSGEGQGQLTGMLDWQGALDVDVKLRGSRLPVIVEPYAELEVAPDLQLLMADGQLLISGQVKVPRGEIVIRELPPSTVEVSEDVIIVGEEAEEVAAPLAIRMDIDVEVGQDQLRFSGFGLTADLAGYLHIGDNLDARGELSLNNGRYRAYGQRLVIRRAQLLFTGVLTQPFLDIEAIRKIDAENVIAGLRITGSAEQPRVEVFSEPAMSQEQALSYLVMGRALGTDAGDSNLLARAALGLGLGLAGSSSFTGGVAQRLGIADFQLDTEGSGEDTSVVASGRLSERLTLRYGVGVFEPANTVALRYRLTQRLFLEAASGLASSLDLFYRRDF